MNHTRKPTKKDQSTSNESHGDYPTMSQLTTEQTLRVAGGAYYKFTYKWTPVHMDTLDDEATFIVIEDLD